MLKCELIEPNYNMEQPKISFLVAIYNVAPYIERCVRSLYSQTLKEIEIILVDDCSPDDSLKIAMDVLEEYPNRKEQVVVVRHETNKGVPTTRWDGIMAASSSYVTFVDGDDYVEPNMAEVYYNKIQENNVDMILSDIYGTIASGEAFIISPAPNGVIGNGDNVRDDTINIRVFTSACSKLYKKSLFTEHERFWPVKGMYDDVCICAYTLSNAQSLAYVPLPLYHYCYNPTSYVSNSNINHHVKILHEIEENYAVYHSLLASKGLLERNQQGIFRFKLGAKYRMIDHVGQRKWRRLFLRTYPEINRIFLFGNKYRHPTYRERLWMLSIMLGIYHLPRVKKLIYSKRFRPRPEWSIEQVGITSIDDNR